jgi:hypothetical protein
MKPKDETTAINFESVVSQKMIDAGVMVLLEADKRVEGLEEIVSRIYAAMKSLEDGTGTV